MSHDPSEVLKAFRDVLRNPIQDVDSFIDHLQSTARGLSLTENPISTSSEDDKSKAIKKFLPSVQNLLISNVIPNLLHLLDVKQKEVIQLFFIPSKSPTKLNIYRRVTLVSYLSLPPFLAQQAALPIPSRSYVLEILSKLGGIDELYWSIWSTSNKDSTSAKTILWEEAVKACLTIPAKAANAVGRWKSERWEGDLPSGLVAKWFYEKHIVRLEYLMYELSQTTSDTSRMTLVIHRLASLGLFTARPTKDPSNPSASFFTSFLPSALSHLHPKFPLPPYPEAYLSEIFLSLSPSNLASIVTSLLLHLMFHPPPQVMQPDKPNEHAKRCAIILTSFVGPPKIGGEAWEAIMRGITGRKQHDTPMGDHEHSWNRVVVSWIAQGEDEAIQGFISSVIDTWCDTRHIKYTLYSTQFNLTHCLLLAVSQLQPYHPRLKELSHRSTFLVAIQAYLSHPDPKIRRLGMLVAEIISQLTIPESNGFEYDEKQEIEDLKAGLDGENVRPTRGGPVKRLDFGEEVWGGEGQGKEECRWLRRCLGVRDEDAVLGDEHDAWQLGWDRREIGDTTLSASSIPSMPGSQAEDEARGKRAQSGKHEARFSKAKPPGRPKIVMLDEAQSADPLQGYTLSSPSSSRSPSPTPSYLEEIANDPSLAVGAQNKKITKPVYIQQLVSLLKEREKPDELEMALKWGESLVRAKRLFGTELTENAVNVAVLVIAIQDTFNLEDFDEKRQCLLNALVACSPKQVAPFLSEQYFNGQYSLQQRSVILTSLAMGARELAGLSVPTTPSTRRVDFPSKTLPPALHNRYITNTDYTNHQLEEAISGVRGLILHKEARKGEEMVPELAREKRLRVGASKRTMVAEVGTLNERQMTQSSRNGNPSVNIQRPVTPFSEIAAEYFIMPLINRFWQYYQDFSTRESRSYSSNGGGGGTRYRGAGTGLILSPMSLEKFLTTLGLLVHASRHSSVFLTIIAPESIELALTIGSGPLARTKDENLLTGPDEEITRKSTGQIPSIGNGRFDAIQEETEAQVLASALELILISLDSSFELDQARTISRDKPELILAVGEWAQSVFERENKGERSSGSGGMREGRVRGASAGVVVKIAEVEEKWALGGMGSWRN